ncbi:Cof-type HAD-IIB family hydrolase [Enterococcus nangangensis]
MIKLLALDLDGTLLTDDKKISAKNIATLKKAQQAGIKVVITTGRPLRAIAPFVAALDLTSPEEYAITFNGGLVQQIATGKILGKNALDFEAIPAVYDAFKDLDLPLSVLSEEMVYEFPTSSSHPSIYAQLNPLLTYQDVALQDLTPTRIYNKFVSAADEKYLDAKIPLLPPALQEQFEIMKSRKVLLEILPKGVSKAQGLAILGTQLGISAAEMMSFGDEENDLSMIEWCGVGVAMANANPVVKAKANFISKSNQEDGVSYAIEKLIFQQEV